MMNEYSIRVFALVSQSHKLDARDRQEDLVIAVTPFADKGTYGRVMKGYEEIVNEPLADLDEAEHKKGIAQLKNIFKGRKV